jgi:hypothetical protein
MLSDHWKKPTESRRRGDVMAHAAGDVIVRYRGREQISNGKTEEVKLTHVAISNLAQENTSRVLCDFVLSSSGWFWTGSC